MAEQRAMMDAEECKALASEIAEVRRELEIISSRLILVNGALKAEHPNPDTFTVEGATSVLSDTIRLLSETTSKLMEQTALSEYLDRAGEVAHA